MWLHLCMWCVSYTSFLHSHNLESFPLSRTPGGWNPYNCFKVETCKAEIMHTSIHPWPIDLHAVRSPTARQHSSISYSKLLSRLCCFIIDYRVWYPLMCVNTAGLCLSSAIGSLCQIDCGRKIIKSSRIRCVLCKATLVFKHFCRLKRVEFCFFKSLRMCHTHPYSLRSRHRKFRACFYLPCTIAALCFPKLELLLRGNRYRGRTHQSPLIVKDHNLCYRRGIVVSVHPSSKPLLCCIHQKKSTVLCMYWWVELSFNLNVKEHAHTLTVWQECHLLASYVTAAGDDNEVSLYHCRHSANFLVSKWSKCFKVLSTQWKIFLNQVRTHTQSAAIT